MASAERTKSSNVKSGNAAPGCTFPGFAADASSTQATRTAFANCGAESDSRIEETGISVSFRIRPARHRRTSRELSQLVRRRSFDPLVFRRQNRATQLL